MRSSPPRPRRRPVRTAAASAGALLLTVAIIITSLAAPGAAGAAEIAGILALRRADGSAELRRFGPAGEEPVTAALAGLVWRPLSLRRSSPERVAAGGLVAVAGPLPCLRLGDGRALVLYASPAAGGASGLAVIDASSAAPVLHDAGERYRLLPDGACLSHDARLLGLVFRGGETAGGEDVEDLVILDLTAAPIAAHAARFPPNTKKVEAESLAWTRGAAFAAARDDGGQWSVYRFRRPAAGAPAGAIDGERVAGPFERIEPFPAASETAIAFAAGADNDTLDVFVAGDGGPAVDITLAPGRYLGNEADRTHLTLSPDGCRVAFNLLVGGEPEVFVQEACSSGPEGRVHITADPRFNPYIDQETWIFFVDGGRLILDGGHDEVTRDLYGVPVDAPDGSINLTGTGSTTMPFTRGSLTLRTVRIAADGGLIVAEATHLDGGATDILLVDPTTGRPALAVAGYSDMRDVFRLGDELVFVATSTGGAAAILRVADGGLEKLAESPSGAAPQRIALEPDRALLALAGAGVLEIAAGRPPRLLAALPGAEAATAPAISGDLVLWAQPDGAGGVDYRLVHLADGTSAPVLPDADPAAQVIAFAALADPALFARGDANDDSQVDISDALRTLLYLFAGGAAPPCADAADADDSGTIEITDAVRILMWLFAGAAPLPPPFPGPGPDPTPDALACPQRR